MVYISTDCSDDLSAESSDLVRFEKPSDERQSPCPPVLKYQNQWFVGSKSGCSCTFRHLYRESVELGFSQPQDWYPEEVDEIEATRRLYDVLNRIVQLGFKVELLDCWSGDEENKPQILDVSMSQVPRDRFRMFEGYLFNLQP